MILADMPPAEAVASLVRSKVAECARAAPEAININEIAAAIRGAQAAAARTLKGGSSAALAIEVGQAAGCAFLAQLQTRRPSNGR